MKDFFNSFTKLVKKYSKVVITTHKNMDLDGFASAICLFKIFDKMNKDCYIFLNETQTNNTIIKTFEQIEKVNYDLKKLYSNELNTFDTTDTLLIIVDVHKISLVEGSELCDIINDVVVIDHHVKSSEYIKDTKLMYINSNMSSVSQIIVEYSKYMNYKVDEFLATILLAAIEIDTNRFKFKTTEGTYEVAAYLTKLGANSILKQEILRESRESYLEHQFYIEQSLQINENMILCEIDDKVVSPKDLAIIADSLLQFENMEASFCIGKLDNKTYGISARSLGNVNVQEIMQQLGGGGHMTEAATKLENITIDECRTKLLNIVNGG